MRPERIAVAHGLLACTALASLPSSGRRPHQQRDFLAYAGPSVINNKQQGVIPAGGDMLEHVHADFVAGAITHGRYGHNAVYQASQNRVLFIGGQVGESGSQITNDVLVLDLGQPAPSSSNPVSESSLSHGLTPHAWAAGAIDEQEEIWIIGGVTEDCTTDPLAVKLAPSQQAWQADIALPLAPPRRRQAAGLALPGNNGTSNIYVWGGIAESYTCSADTVGYLGMDVWATAPGGNVTTVPLTRPPQATADWMPPVSDYATVGWAEGQVLLLGGQQADGVLSSFCNVLVFESLTHTWTLEAANTTGVCPTARMGHVAFPISDTQLIIHGGVGVDNVPSGDMWLLDGAPGGKWGWSKPALSSDSLPPPSRAWQTATRINDTLVVIAFGIDTNISQSSSDIFYLSRSPDNSWTWSATWTPLAAEQASSPVVSTISWANTDDAAPTSTLDSGAVYQPIVAAPSSFMATASVDATPPPSSYQDAADTASSGGGKTAAAVGGTIGGILGAAALAGLVGLYFRRKSTARSYAAFPSPEPVSSMQFARPPMRVLSLGHDLPPRSPLGSRTAPQPQMSEADAQGEILDFLYPNAKSRRASAVQQHIREEDPFSDGHAAEDENADANVASPPSDYGSVQSYPYLTAIPLVGGRSDSSMSHASSAAIVNAESRTSLGIGRPAIRVESSDTLTRLPSRGRYTTGPRAASNPLLRPRNSSNAPPSSPYMLGNTAGLLRVTNQPATPASPDRSAIL